MRCLRARNDGKSEMCKDFDAHIAPEIAVNREFLAIYAFIVRVLAAE
jgi:hypothetical protein